MKTVADVIGTQPQRRTTSGCYGLRGQGNTVGAAVGSTACAPRAANDNGVGLNSLEVAEGFVDGAEGRSRQLHCSSSYAFGWARGRRAQLIHAAWGTPSRTPPIACTAEPQ